MSNEAADQADDRVERALAELEGLIRQRYPDATFEVFHGEDPDGTYLRATVDVDDVDEVVDVFRDRLIELQVEEGIPVYVIPVEPLGRAARRARWPQAAA